MYTLFICSRGRENMITRDEMKCTDEGDYYYTLLYMNTYLLTTYFRSSGPLVLVNALKSNPNCPNDSTTYNISTGPERDEKRQETLTPLDR